jgi:hypothetical protein
MNTAIEPNMLSFCVTLGTAKSSFKIRLRTREQETKLRVESISDRLEITICDATTENLMSRIYSDINEDLVDQ